MKHTRRKKSSGLATRRIVYRNRKHPHARAQELTVDIRQGEHLDTDYAAAMVAVRTGTPLADVTIIEIREPNK